MSDCEDYGYLSNNKIEEAKSSGSHKKFADKQFSNDKFLSDKEFSNDKKDKGDVEVIHQPTQNINKPRKKLKF
jgi:hypothetical protein